MAERYESDSEFSNDEERQDLEDLFQSDSEEEDFDGFTLEEVLQGANIVREIDMEQSQNDRDLRTDSVNGWSRIDTPPLVAPFTGNPGITVNIPEGADPIYFFKLFFPDEFLTILKENTDLYAERNIAKKQPRDRFHQWKPTTENELKIFLALVISMGLPRKSNVEDYWSTEPAISTPLFSKYMAKDKFLLLLCHLHIIDNRQMTNLNLEQHI